MTSRVIDISFLRYFTARLSSSLPPGEGTAWRRSFIANASRARSSFWMGSPWTCAPITSPSESTANPPMATNSPSRWKKKAKKGYLVTREMQYQVLMAKDLSTVE